MKKYEGYLICTDMDGTLLNDKHVISEENKEAILHFMDEGGLFTVATGRTPKAIAPIFNDFLPNSPIITHNGAAVYDLKGDKYLSVESLDQGAIEVLEYVEKNFDTTGFEVYDRSDIYFYKVNEFIRWHAGVENLDITLSDYREIPMPWTKAMFVQAAEQTNELRNHLMKTPYWEKYSFIRSDAIFLEILSPKATKGNALVKLKQMMPDKIHTTIAIGDNENDISLLGASDISFAVENAIDDLKAVAKSITVRNTEHALLRVIQSI
ncbi:MAG: Cof-type HAD-IIB family hydrolase [Eubacteriales bacterium]|jgi:Cof subfamily protein (haloacid dehalogenase superfamily)|nr:Cof-type HAD-IIB family hydrolase [Eubacteriales bacterium]